MALRLPSVGDLVDAILPWWKAVLGAALMFPAAFLLGQCDGAKKERHRVEAAQAVAVATAVKRDSASKEVAARERAADTTEVAKMTEELTDAVAELPDSAPSDRRVALGCARLRQQGLDTAGLAVCGRPEAGREAPARAGGPR